MREFGNGALTLEDATATNLLALAQADGYAGTALVENLTLDAPDGTDLYHRHSSDVDETNGRKILSGTSYTFPRQVDISQIWVYQNSGAPTTFGASFTGLGV